MFCKREMFKSWTPCSAQVQKLNAQRTCKRTKTRNYCDKYFLYSAAPDVWKAIFGFLGLSWAVPALDLFLEQQDPAGWASTGRALGWNKTPKTPLAQGCKSALAASTALIRAKHWRCNSNAELRAQISCWSSAEGGKNKQGRPGIPLLTPDTFRDVAAKIFCDFILLFDLQCFAEEFLPCRDVTQPGFPQNQQQDPEQDCCGPRPALSCSFFFSL